LISSFQLHLGILDAPNSSASPRLSTVSTVDMGEALLPLPAAVFTPFLDRSLTYADQGQNPLTLLHSPRMLDKLHCTASIESVEPWASGVSGPYPLFPARHHSLLPISVACLALPLLQTDLFSVRAVFTLGNWTSFLIFTRLHISACPLSGFAFRFFCLGIFLFILFC